MSNEAKKFLNAALIRAGHTAAQTALAMIGTDAVITDVSWITVISAVTMATLVSLLKSVVIGMPEVPEENEGGGRR